jgi:hypothetical protein
MHYCSYYADHSALGGSYSFTSPYVCRIFASTWNVGGKSPSRGLDLDDWLHSSPPADIYVLGYVLSFVKSLQGFHNAIFTSIQQSSCDIFLLTELFFNLLQISGNCSLECRECSWHRRQCSGEKVGITYQEDTEQESWA